MARGREKFAKFKPIINLIGKCYSILPKSSQRRALERHRKTTGNLGLVLRYALVKNLARQVGDNVMIAPDVYLLHVENLSLGNNVSLHPMTYIEAMGGVTIGNDTAIASGAAIYSNTHTFSDLDVPIRDQELVMLPVTIGENVWIGAKSIILGGMELADGTIVGAGSVVTHPTRPYTTVAGVPAREIRDRKESTEK